MQTIKCAICDTNQKANILFAQSIDFSKVDKNTFSARRIPEKVHYQLLKCKNCGLIFSSPILPPNKIKLLYRDSTVTYNEEIPSLKKTYGNYLKIALKYASLNPSLLEIGSGNGFFLEQVKEMGLKDFWGIEPGRGAIQMARKDIKRRLIQGFFPTKQIQNKLFDIICVLQTLDHIIDPNKFLKECLKALNRGGIILCILHDTEGLSVKLLGERSPIFDIEHIYLFNKSNLKKIFENDGFRVVEIFDVKNNYPLLYWLRMLPLPGVIKFTLVQLVKLVKLDKLEIALKAGNIGIIAQK